MKKQKRQNMLCIITTNNIVTLANIFIFFKVVSRETCTNAGKKNTFRSEYDVPVCYILFRLRVIRIR